LEEIENINDFVQKLEKIEMPNQLVAVIGDPLLQHLLQLKSNKVIVRRIDNWLTAFFEDQLESGAQTGSTPLLDMLTAIRDYTSFTKVVPTELEPHVLFILTRLQTIPSACLVYLRSLLGYWNGVEGRDVILDLLTYIPLAPFEGM
jgi:centromere protein I